MKKKLNEKIQTVNEDPEISYEILQPLNEELNNVNAQMKTNHIQETLVLCVDATGFENPQVQLRKERDLLQTVIDSTRNFHLAYLDRDFNFVRVNKTYAQGSGYSQEELIGQNHFALFPNEDNEIIFRRVRDTGIAEEFHDKPFFCPDHAEHGKTYWDWVLTPIRDNDRNVAGLVLALTETTERKRAEEKLQMRESRMRRIAQTGRIGFVEWNASKDSAYWSPEHYDLFGFEQGSPVSWERWLGGVHPADRERVLANADRLLAQGRSEGPVQGHKDEYRYIRADGSIVWLESDMAIEMIGGDVVVSGSVRDITERKKAEEAIRRSEERWNLAIESFAEGAIIATWDEQVIYWNPAARAMHGFTDPNEGIGPLEKTPLTFELWTPDRNHKLEFDEWPMRRIKRGETLHNLELRIRRPDQGWEKVFSYRGSMIETADREKLIFLSVSDLTEQRTAERALLEERELLNALFNSIPVMLTLYDPHSLTFKANAYLEQVTGWTNEDLQKPDAMEKVYPDTEYRVMVTDYVRSLQPGFKDLLMTAKNGEIIETSWANIQLPDGRQVGIGLDIRARKRMEEQIRRRAEELVVANRELESFTYTVSHDLRAPLRAIKGFSNILLEDYSDKLDEDGTELLMHITTSTNKMASIIDDMLSLAKLSKESIKCEKTDLTPIAESIVNELRQAEPMRNVIVNIGDEMAAFADARLMTIALSNLIGNAWKYTGKNPGAHISIGILFEENEDVFFVHDNGAGFDMKFAHKLFQPFQRLHSDNQFPGTGIGLAIVYKIIQHHGGRIWAESEIGKGTTFYFTLACPQEG
jgi:PAS domain S-box-containing protein